MTLLHLLRKARVFYPLTSVYDLLIAGLEELLYQNMRYAYPYKAWADKNESKWRQYADSLDE